MLKCTSKRFYRVCSAVHFGFGLRGFWAVLDGHLGHGAASRRAKLGAEAARSAPLDVGETRPSRPFPHPLRETVSGAPLPIESSIGCGGRARSGSPRTTQKSAS